MISADRVRVEHMKPPVVIDRKHPLISWCTRGDADQGAYQITAKGNLGTTYDSHVVKSEKQHMRIPVNFKSRERIEVQIRLWDEKEAQSVRSMDELFYTNPEIVRIVFEMGIQKDDWHGKWINPELRIPDKRKERPASYLKKTFTAFEGTSRLYITAHGVYNVYLNGKHLDGFVMAPGTSEYEKILQYQTYDLTAVLVQGENEILITLGNGWWRGTTTYDGIRNAFGEDVSVLAQIETDGKVICETDETWVATQEGPIRDTDNMMGEIYDARLEKRLQQDKSIWHGVRLENYGYENLCCSNCPPPIEHEKFKPKMLTTPKGEKVLDFGQNIAGYVSFEFDAKEGESILLTHGETLDVHGNFCMSNFQSPNFYCAQEIRYTCKEGRNQYKPTNTFMGFRYVKIEGSCWKSEKEFTAHAVYTDLELTAVFSCGREDINQLFHNALWSLKGNLLDIPTDCPTREKSGFTGDMVTFIHSFLYLMDAWPMVQKFIANLSASQYEDGCVKQIVADPRPRGPMDGAGGWSNAFEILLEKLGELYDDYALFEEYQDSILRWVEFLIQRAAGATRPKHLDNPWHEYLDDAGIHWGEWAEPYMDFPVYYRNLMEHGEPEVGTAYLANACAIFARQLKREGRKEEAERFEEITRNSKRAYCYEYISAGRIVSERMCRYIRPVVLDLIDENEKKQAVEDLNHMVIENKYRLNTGFLTTPELCRTLSDYGYVDTAYKILLNEDIPGWLYSVKNGATTIPENWDAYAEDGKRNASFNHYSYGSIIGWLMDTVAGIRIREKELLFCPKPYKELGFVKAEYLSPRGMVRSEWKICDDTCRFKVEIPHGYHAKMIFPSGKEIHLKSGIHSFEELV